jgi:hypothetical protein
MALWTRRNFSFLFSDFVPLFRKAVLRNAGKTTDLDLVYCGSTNYGGGRPSSWSQAEGLHTISCETDNCTKSVFVFLFRLCARMDIFENVERETGPYTTWPSYILKYLYCEHLNITNRMILCAFFYGNRLSPHWTVDLIRSCERSFDDSSDARSIQNWFQLWNKSKAARAKKKFTI